MPPEGGTTCLPIDGFTRFGNKNRKLCESGIKIKTLVFLCAVFIYTSFLHCAVKKSIPQSASEGTSCGLMKRCTSCRAAFQSMDAIFC